MNYIYTFKKSNINEMGNIISYLIALITRLKNFTSKDSGIHFIIPNETKFVLQKINIICFPYLSYFLLLSTMLTFQYSDNAGAVK